MLDLFENGNFRRRRRRRNLKVGFREPVDTFAAAGSNAPRPRDSEPFCPLAPCDRSSQLNPAALSKPEPEIKFSIDYILSTPDPHPGLRPHHCNATVATAGPSITLLEPQHLNLHFWTLWSLTPPPMVGYSSLKQTNSTWPDQTKCGRSGRKNTDSWYGKHCRQCTESTCRD